MYSGAFCFEEEEGLAPAAAHRAPAAAPADDQLPAATVAPPPERGPPPALPAPRPLVYVRSDRLAQLSAGLPINRDRSVMTDTLVEDYGLLQDAAVRQAPPASLEQLQGYHSREYLAALAHWDKLSERRRAAYGLEDDCAPFPGLYEHAALTAGGSLAAAEALCAGEARLAVHWDGGRHHAGKGKAAGFCYVNDVVLAILRLLSSFRRVLYLDVDVHHGDAAFLLSPRVLTISLHKAAPGFYPGTGALGAGGEGTGRGFALNLPLGDGLRDNPFLQAVAALAGGAAAAFQPDVVVLQCGVDGLAHDPLAGSWSLTPAAYARAAELAASWGRPLLLLGGGGYCAAAAAATWTGVLAQLLGKAPLPDDIPAEHEYLDRYGPSYTLSAVIKRLLPPDTNDASAVLAACEGLLAELRSALARQARHGGSGAAAAAQQKPDCKRARS
ncbi:Histone deacetylase 8 [Micractinium conductrix]|uniref:histone deacetylase n=1 Tax=Micractinium conductrix TaxID=554055 RepID=A0A2P6V561_9CHLO|nr:Histone deacetylase 8 [Micractinium conductrix]|eukprot:PSC69225.1 Histone deacetylase 8 [Micractinium conductrix]